jgi:hypothetical protein
LAGTTVYLMFAFAACDFAYYGFAFVYPHILEQLFRASEDQAKLNLTPYSLDPYP